MPEITRLDYVQDDTGPALRFHAVRTHPTAGPTAVASPQVASALWVMRHTGSGASAVYASIPATKVAGTAAASAAWFLEVQWPAGAFATPGQYRGQLTMTMTDGTRQTVPTDEPFLLVVRARV
jgi:hypothetical protein